MKTQSRLLNCVIGILSIAFVSSRASAEDKVDFEKQVLPILKSKCIKCHTDKDDKGAAKKPKGGLLLTTAEGIKKGGKEDGDKVLIAGKSADSTLVKVMALPESDDKAMPPEGKGDRVSKEDQDLIKKWIDGGADFGAWKGVAK
ncbi:MAG: hypothetical protein K8R87_06215 [Verrucomicrobia bacterium]|nr:hypothetical protein [Verrucomicrobiota bacterium]